MKRPVLLQDSDRVLRCTLDGDLNTDIDPMNDESPEDLLRQSKTNPGEHCFDFFKIAS